ncbi:MAG: hypothetical protein NT045_03125 [Candidatus Aureabacteria bacterium]|nr:hypothetical protein [Candidatus Auribacterota bacterium]
MRAFMQAGIVVLVGAIAVTQIFLFFKYLRVSRALFKLQDQSSGDHNRYKGSTDANKKDGNGG